MRGSKIAAIAAGRDSWTKKAFAACLAAAKDLIGPDGPIRPGLAIGKLADSEWIWIIHAVIWAWVAGRAEQAASEGLDAERATRVTSLIPDPWDDGAIAAILPELADTCPNLDWSKPIGEWAKGDIVELLAMASALIPYARAARDAVEEKVAGKIPQASGATQFRPITDAELDRVFDQRFEDPEDPDEPPF
jgi:hypothetical protein